MDAPSSAKVNSGINKVYGLFLKIENTYPTPNKTQSSVIKYTKIPEYDKVLWPEDNYTLQPRLRRIISLQDPSVTTVRSLKSELAMPPKTISTNISKRKIVTISEDDENDIHSKFAKGSRKHSPVMSNRAAGPESKEDLQTSQRTTSRLKTNLKYPKETKLSAKSNITNNKYQEDKSKLNNKSKYSTGGSYSTQCSKMQNAKMRSVKEKDFKTKSANVISSKGSLSRKNIVTPSESEKEITEIKSKLMNNMKDNILSKKYTEKSKVSKAQPQLNSDKVLILKEIHSRNKPVSIIHVPLDTKYQKHQSKPIQTDDYIPNYDSITRMPTSKVEQSTEMDNTIMFQDINIGTDSPPKTVDQATDIVNSIEISTDHKYEEETKLNSKVFSEAYDSLEIPNVTLLKDKSEYKDILTFHSKSLSNLQNPTIEMSPYKDANEHNCDINYSNSSSYIISRATLTYTSKQKINFHIVGSEEETCSNRSPSPLSYPVSVMSVLKKEMIAKESSVKSADNMSNKNRKNHAKKAYCLNELKTVDYSYVFNSNKLMKPSDIISTIEVNNSLLQSDYICEQFHRELNFIDSFFESLQYLESCSLSDRCFKNNNVDSLVRNTPVLFDSGFDLKNSEYTTLLSKLENGENDEDSETMASKSLCLLNLLIRDEQRRAKNLLFVLKMREDALKDFTKSQILWLENKKKQDNTDISTLKKKQRGALLKLQHECGEMQRMRKALLTLSEKRKNALMKTKKHIELKLRDNVDVEQILLGKKKLKRGNGDRNTAPLKCFDLSSSGCDDSTLSRPCSDLLVPAQDMRRNGNVVNSVEKCIQTGESEYNTVLIDQTTDTAAENFVVVDGGYLNILFQNLTLPQIFSSGKQYEVNEEALRNIVNSANSHHTLLSSREIVEKLMDQIKNREFDRSSSPSTAHSLVDEFDELYKGLENGSLPIGKDYNEDYKITVSEIRDKQIQASPLEEIECRQQSTSTMTISTETDNLIDECGCNKSLEDKESLDERQAGPLPVPAGEAAVPEAPDPFAISFPKLSDLSIVEESSSVSSVTNAVDMSSMTSLTTPVNCEAEELRRQQLAIEREIKALEQQQCRLLVVREIPDKPPPPYTPPAETKSLKPPRMFLADETTDNKINDLVVHPDDVLLDSNNAFDVFVKDFCQESLQRQKPKQTDKPWDSCNLLPKKPAVSVEKLIENTTADFQEVLTGVTPTIVSGVGARRSDHIDDILFAEWRRCEPEWTSLHTDEAIVKNQLFESIFQKILSETVDEYKKILCSTTE